jgi:serine/threonine protein kinase
VARARLEPVAAVRSPGLPDWLEAGVGEWGQRSVVWASANTPVTATLASPPPDLGPPSRLRAVASAARGAHALHERGQLHGAICPQAIAFTAPAEAGQTGFTSTGQGTVGTVLAPPSLADGDQPLAQIGYPPLAYIDPQLLRGEGGRWSDIWALGAAAHYALTGSAPFPGIEDLPVVQALAQLLMAPAPARRELPAAVSSLVAGCLAPDPADRPSTAEEVARHLDEAAANW